MGFGLPSLDDLKELPGIDSITTSSGERKKKKKKPSKVPKTTTKPRGGPSRPPRSQPARVTDDAKVWAAEQTIQPWQLPKPRKPKPGDRDFVGPVRPGTIYPGQHPFGMPIGTVPQAPYKARDKLRRKRVQWAED